MCGGSWLADEWLLAGGERALSWSGSDARTDGSPLFVEWSSYPDLVRQGGGALVGW
ncbi:hypothetical protein BKA81DRAFT_368703 [Phyllosticta paracitricarpa]